MIQGINGLIRTLNEVRELSQRYDRNVQDWKAENDRSMALWRGRERRGGSKQHSPSPTDITKFLVPRWPADCHQAFVVLVRKMDEYLEDFEEMGADTEILQSEKDRLLEIYHNVYPGRNYGEDLARHKETFRGRYTPTLKLPELATSE